MYKRKHQTVTLAAKVLIICKDEKGKKRKKDIATDLGISEKNSSLPGKCDFQPGRKCTRHSPLRDVEAAMVKWAKELREMYHFPVRLFGEKLHFSRLSLDMTISRGALGDSIISKSEMAWSIEFRVENVHPF